MSLDISDAGALSNYQLGDVLGRGASGSVYRALNFLTGETVAIKSISLLTLAPSSLPDIMSEIELLKNLHHPNIVQYKGFARDKDNLFIILEYCENGSLQTILRKFGKFPESLVAVYVSQVLEGLIYLHEQGVIHRDIKGANILTNKDGSVKLADFGVSSRTAGPKLDESENEVVGSPYWMAPEVIEQSGAGTASDIWSVGCVVVELLEGKPPYADLAPMQALWRIVQDEAMKVPDGASPIVKDFLYHCFQKDPNLRVTARKLLRHPWMLSAKKAIGGLAPTTDARPSTRLSTTDRPVSSGSSSRAATSDALSRGIAHSSRPLATSASQATADAKTAKPVIAYDDVVHRVQEWNKALKAPPRDLVASRNDVHSTKQSRPHRPRPSLSGILPSAFPTQPSEQDASAGPSQPRKSQPARQEEIAESWDDDFASDITLPSAYAQPRAGQGEADHDHSTLRPAKRSLIKDSAPSTGLENGTFGPSAPVGKTVEDYSDILTDEDPAGLQLKLANLKLRTKARSGILHPDDLRRALRPKASKTPPRSYSIPKAPTRPAAAPPITSASSSASARSAAMPRGSSTPSSDRFTKARTDGETSEGLRKYSEDAEDDWADVFDGQPPVKDQSDTLSLRLTSRTNRSWQDSNSLEDVDPFASMDDELDVEEDIEAQLLRDRKATLQADVTRLVERLAPGATDLGQTCDEILVTFATASELGLESHFVANQGLLVCVHPDRDEWALTASLLEVLESRLSRETAVRVLKLVNHIVGTELDVLESFCLIGGIPVVIPFTSKRYSLDTRLEASVFVKQLTKSPLTLQMFISCRGLRILIELLDEDYMENRTLVLSSLEGIGSVFDLQSPTPRNDFCRMFIREGILDPLSLALLSILKDKELKDTSFAARAINVILLFCQVAQADQRVQAAFASRTIMMRLLRACEALPRKLLVTAVKAVKHLSTSPRLIEILQNSNATEVLVTVLGKHISGSHSNICSQIFQTIYSMCRLSSVRQEEAASSGIVPLLKAVITGKSPLKQFALPIFCDLASAGKQSRRILWQNDGLRLYINLLEDPYWRVSALDAILTWMQDETARVEDVLLDDDSKDGLVKCFVQASGTSFEGILDPLLKILRLSSSVSLAIADPPFIRRLADALSRSGKTLNAPSPVAKLDLLRIARLTLEHHPDREALISQSGIADVVQDLASNDEAVLVRRLAQEILPSLEGRSANDAARPTADAVSVQRHSSRSHGDGYVASSSSGRGRNGQAAIIDERYPRQLSPDQRSTSRSSSNRSPRPPMAYQFSHLHTRPLAIAAAMPTNGEMPTDGRRSSASGKAHPPEGYRSSKSGAGRSSVLAAGRTTDSPHSLASTAVRPTNGTHPSVSAAVRPTNSPHSSVPTVAGPRSSSRSWVPSSVPSSVPTVAGPTSRPRSSVQSSVPLSGPSSVPSSGPAIAGLTSSSRSSVSAPARPADDAHPSVSSAFRPTTGLRSSVSSTSVRPASHRPSVSMSMPSKRPDDEGRPPRRPFASKPEEVPAKHKRQISRSQLSDLRWHVGENSPQ